MSDTLFSYGFPPHTIIIHPVLTACQFLLWTRSDCRSFVVVVAVVPPPTSPQNYCFPHHSIVGAVVILNHDRFCVRIAYRRAIPVPGRERSVRVPPTTSVLTVGQLLLLRGVRPDRTPVPSQLWLWLRSNRHVRPGSTDRILVHIPSRKHSVGRLLLLLLHHCRNRHIILLQSRHIHHRLLLLLWLLLQSGSSME